ncbi:MAG: lyase family protein, partial [Acidimicrobiia bacterium]
MRIERDSMGEIQVPDGAYYGASTQRAVDNFPISNLRFGRSFIWAMGLLKASAAVTNKENGSVDAEIADAITAAAEEVMTGGLDDHFVLDIFQTGSGTSTNVNANE